MYIFQCSSEIKVTYLIPPYQESYEGKTVTFNCTVTENVMWTFNEQSGFLPKNAATGKYDHQTQFILIRNVRTENSGIYICSGTYANTIIKSIGELKVVGKLCAFFVSLQMIERINSLY